MSCGSASDFSAERLAGVSHLPEPLNLCLLTAAKSTGIDGGQIALLACFLLSIPLGVVHRQLGSPILKRTRCAFV